MLKERITTARTSYLIAYREWLSGAWLHDPDVHERFADVIGVRPVEPGLLRPEMRFEVDDTPDRHPAFRHLCIDGAIAEDGGDVAGFVCEGERVGGTTALTQSYRGLVVTANRIRWDEIVVRVPQDPTSEPAFVDWAADWVDLRERRQPGVDGLCGVVHCVVPPAPRRFVRGRSVDVSIDFGSAPVDALWDLLDRLVEIGTPRVMLGSPA